MAENRARAAGLSLAEMQGHFAAWRQGRTKGARIPPRLWEEARGLHPRHSIYEISHGLRLDYVDVRDRIAGNRERGRKEGAEAGTIRGTAGLGRRADR